MRAKILKKFIAITCILVLILPMTIEVLATISPEDAAAGKTMEFGISQIHKSVYLNGEGEKEFGYGVRGANVSPTKTDPQYAYRIYAANDANKTTGITSVLCLDEFGTFPTESQATNTYTSKGPTNEETIKGMKLSTKSGGANFNDEQAKKIMWLMRNAILPEDSQDMRSYKLSIIMQRLIEINSGPHVKNPLTVDQIKKQLTEDDIIFALQAALWQITNPTTNTTLWGTIGSGYQELGEINLGRNQRNVKDFIQEMINYYLSHSGGEDIIPPQAENVVAPTITTPGTLPTFDVNSDETYFFIGPFSVPEPEAGKETYDYTVEVSFKNSSGEILDAKKVKYALKDGNTNSANKVEKTKAGVEGKGNFYVAINKTRELTGLIITLKPTCPSITDTVATGWTVEGNNDMQPLISVNRTETVIPPVTAEQPFTTGGTRKYDVSLRVNISSVYRKNNRNQWTKVYEFDQEDRDPTFVEHPTRDIDKNFNQYAYTHPKNPVQVEVGDIVNYTITVYNEGVDNDGYRVQFGQITVYLPPKGLNPLYPATENADGEAVSRLLYGDEVVQFSSATSSEEEDDIKTTLVPATAGTPETIVTYKAVSGYAIKNQNIFAINKTGLGAGDPNRLDFGLSAMVTPEAKGHIVTIIGEVTSFKGQVEPGDGSTPYPFDFVKDADSVPGFAKATNEADRGNLTLPDSSEDPTWEYYYGNESLNPNDEQADKTYYYKGQEDDDDYDRIIIPGKNLDLALRKSITAINGTPQASNRIVPPDTSPLTDNNNSTTTSIFNDDKTPLKVHTGDKVTYTIRVFSEGNTDAYASRIEDYIPEGLGFLPNYKDNIDNGWVAQSSSGSMKLCEVANATSHFSESDFEPNGVSGFENQTVIKGKAKIETKKLANEKLKAFDGNLDIHTVQITCIVIINEEDVPYGETRYLKNVAAITEYKDQDGNIVDEDPNDKEDIDSNSDNDYVPKYEEDDEDYEELVLDGEEPAYDLALKKFISSLRDATNTLKDIPSNQKRNLEITSVDALITRGNNKIAADAEYSFGVDKDKVPVQVEKGDLVTYTIRIYNEGIKDAKVGTVIDNVPDGLAFVPRENSKTNDDYEWESFNTAAKPGGWPSGVKTSHFAQTTIPRFDATKVNEPKTFDPNTGIGREKGVSYVELKIEFKVVTDEIKKIKNWAEITEDDGDDVDSEPDDQKEIEDDQDFDDIIPSEQIFDLALRKFITRINEKDITSRIPQVDPSKLISGEATTAIYKHPKQEDIPVVVKGDIVIYTIRVFNEGNVDGYVNEIKDDLPEGIEFLPQHTVNIENEWKMIDASGNVVDDVSKAKAIKTDHRAENKGRDVPYPDGYSKDKFPYFKHNTNIILAYDPTTMKNGPDYIDVQVAFKVTKDIVTDGSNVIINTAQVTEESGEDRDTDDLIDKEYIQLKYFDLSLIKYVSKYFLTVDGQTTEVKCNDGTENPEPVVKIELNKNKLSSIVLKYEFTIRIKNEGEIEGYAKEIKDRIPAGLEFYAEDNKTYGWKVSEPGVVTTDYLKNTLLKPGETATVKIILRWINNENNFGQKVNVAEISKDENEYGVPDIDSTPDNNKDGEDDQDDAPVILSIKTGSVPMYITLIITVITIICSGFYLIYKYVVKR